MANEFVIKNGFISQGDSLVNAILSANTVQILTAPTLNNSNTQILSRNSSTGVIEFSTLSAITTDYYVTGGTYNSGTGTLTLERQNGSVTISGFGTGGGGGLSGDTYVTGFTYSNNSLTISQNGNQPPLSVTIDVMTGLTVNGNVSINGSSLPNGYALSVTGDTNFIGDVYVQGDLSYQGNLLVTGGTIIQNGLTANTVYTDYIDFNTNYTGGTTQGRISWDSGTGTLNIGVGDPGGTLIDLQVGQEEVVRVYNDELTTLNKGEIVYVSGSQGNRPSVKRAIATGDGYSVTTLGMVDANINSGDQGYVTTFGIISNLNTLGLTGGTPIFLSPTVAGAYTSTKPQAPYHVVLIGYVVRVSATVGSVFINISNGWELDEIHDVRINGVTTGDLLMRSSYSGSSLWVNTKTLLGDYTINGELTVTGATNVSYIDFDTTLSGTTSAEGRLFWDVNNRTLSLGMIGGPIQQIGEEQYYLVEAANTILDGRVVGAVGTTGSSGKILADYIISDGSVPAITTLGILTQTLSAGTVGYVTSFGLVRGLDTTGTPYGEVWNDGDVLYISPTVPGGLTKNKPTTPNLEIVIALVIYSNSTNGSIFVRPSIGFGLDQLNDVSITGATNYDILQYDSNTSIWKNTNTPILNTLTINSGLTVDSIYVNNIGQSGNCVTNLFIDNIYGCSPITFQDSIQSIGSGANGTLSFAFGFNTQANGNYSHAEGYYTKSISSNSHAEGIGSNAGAETAFSGTVVSGLVTLNPSYGDVTSYFISGPLFLYDAPFDNLYGRAIFVISAVTFNSPYTEIQLEDLTVSSSTVYVGDLGYLLAFANFGNGDQIINAAYSHAEGQNTVTLNETTHAEGYGSITIGDYSHAEGFNTMSVGETSHSEGKYTIASGTYSHAEGETTQAIGASSHSEGLGAQAIGIGSHAEGRTTQSIGQYSHSEGFNTWAIGNQSHSHGILTRAIGDNSFSSGVNSISSGDTSFIHSTDSLVVGDRSVVLGGTGITGLTSDTVYVPNFNINYTPTVNNLGQNLLAREDNGDVSTIDISTIRYNIKNQVTVGLSGSNVDYNTVKSAINSITGASETNPYTVKVGPGVYYENNPINIPSWVAVVGDDSISTIIQASNPSQTLFYLGDQSAIFDCQIQGVTGTGVSAIVYSSSTTPQSSAISYVENVRFGTNYTHAKVIGSGSANIIMQCSNVKYGGYPFTVGFEATNDGGSAIGRMQLRNVTSTNGGVTTTTGLTFAKSDKPNCGFIVNGCLLTKAAGSPAGVGFYVENGAFLRLTGVNFQRWSTGIYAPQIGSAPSIDAIALNFENCTTDVNIVHSGTTGKINGTDNFVKTQININAPIYEVNQDPREIIVSQKGGDFSSIKAAVDYLITSATTSSNSRYVISVGPGQFYEDEIDLTLTPYVSIVGSNIQTTQVFPNSSTQHLFKIGINNEISFLSVSSVGDGSGTYSAIYCDDIGDFAQAHKISFYDCDVNVWVKSSTQDTKFYGEYLDFNGTYSYGVKVEATNNFLALANVENYYQFPTGTGATIGNYVMGSGSTLNAALCTFEGTGISGTTAFYLEDAGVINVGATDITNWYYGLYNSSSGLGSNFEFIGSSFIDNTYDLFVDRTTTIGYLQGISDHTKIYLTPGTNDVYWSFLDSNDGELDITRKASVTFTDGSHTDFTTLIFEGGTMGLLDGGAITTISGTTIQTALGFGYLEKSDNSGIVRRIDWSNTQITLPTNSNEYIYINENGNLSSSGSKPNSFYNIILGRVVTNSTSVEFIDLSPLNGEHTSNRFSNLFTEALGPIYASGSIVTEGSTPLTIDVTSGEYYFSTNEFMPTGGTGLTFTQYYRFGSGATWVTTATTIVNNTQWDNNGVLTGLTSGYYTKHTLYLVGQGGYENYFLILGQNQFPTLVEVEDALLPTPPTYFNDSVVQIANIYVQEGTSGFTQVEDIRPTIAFKAGGVNASSVHSNLLGLSSDDHIQYLLVNGGRAMSGNLDMGNNAITSASTVNGVVVQSHASRHLPNGSDPLTTGTPSSVGSSNQEGILNAFARQDHIHQLGSNVVLDDNIATQVSTKITITGKTQLNNFIVYTDQVNNAISATTYYGDGSNLTGLITSDYYVTGGTFNPVTNILTLDRQNGSVIITGFTSSTGPGTDNYVTGGTYSNGTLTLDRQNGSVSVTGFTNGIKANSIAGGSFTGNPRKATVTFISPYSNTNYSITITGNVNRSFTWESKATTGFTINSNANTSFTEDVNWITMSYGEF